MDQFDDLKALILDELRKTYPGTIIGLWFSPMEIREVRADAMVLAFPSSRKPFVESNSDYFGSLQRAINKVMQTELKLKLVTLEEETQSAEPEQDPEQEPAPKNAYAARFNPNYTFENFIVGKSNQLAQMAALGVANQPFDLNNPLYLYGPPGLGKTHLMFAIVNQLRKEHPEYRILYVTGEEFGNELMEGLAQHKPVAFREKYRNLDVLLVDDIQFIAGKLSTMEEFFHTFETLYKANKQLILASDKPPQEIANLDERLQTRCAMGLVADIQPPDLELRTAIFRRKALDYGFDLGYPVLSYLAEHITKNIRQIEGAIKKLRAHCLITGEPCTVQVAERVLSDFLKSQDTDDNVVDKIFALTEKKFGVSKDELLGNKRTANIAFARHFAIFLVRQNTTLSQKQIASLFHKKDHTTIMNSINVIEEKKRTDSVFSRDVDLVLDELKK